MKSNQGINLMEASNQWRSRPADERYETLTGLRDAVHSRRIRCRSIDIDSNKVEASEGTNGGLIINSSISPVTPSHWAFSQLCQAARIGGVAAPAAYMRQLPTDLAVRCLNEGLRNGDREAHKFMTIVPDSNAAPETPGILQAVTSTTYGRIWDADVVDSVSRIVERTGGKFFNPPAIVDGQQRPSGLYASDHDVFVFMVDGGSRLQAGDRAQLHRGFFTWNSETGAKTFGLCMFLFNEVCGNHIIWGARDIQRLVIKHCSGGPSRFDLEAAPALKAYAESSATLELDTIKKAQGMLLPDFSKDDKILLDWTIKNGIKLTRSELANSVTFAKSEEGDCRTVWQLLQGATAYARGFDFIDSRVDLETRAGKLLNLAAN